MLEIVSMGKVSDIAPMADTESDMDGRVNPKYAYCATSQ